MVGGRKPTPAMREAIERRHPSIYPPQHPDPTPEFRMKVTDFLEAGRRHLQLYAPARLQKGVRLRLRKWRSVGEGRKPERVNGRWRPLEVGRVVPSMAPSGVEVRQQEEFARVARELADAFDLPYEKAFEMCVSVANAYSLEKQVGLSERQKGLQPMEEVWRRLPLMTNTKMRVWLSQRMRFVTGTRPPGQGPDA